MNKTINNQDKEEYSYLVSFETAENNMLVQNVVITSPNKLDLPRDRETIINILKKGEIKDVTNILYLIPQEECTSERLQAEYIFNLCGGVEGVQDYLEFAKDGSTISPKVLEELKKL